MPALFTGRGRTKLLSLAIAALTLAVAGCTEDTKEGYTLSGKLSGFSGSEALRVREGMQILELHGDGDFKFERKFMEGEAYSVQLVAPVPGLSCTVTDGAGYFGAANIDAVRIVCAKASYKVGGTVKGLPEGRSVTLKIDSDETVVIGGMKNAIDQDFAFPTPLAMGTSYVVTARAIEPLVCTFAKDADKGTVGDHDVTTVQLTCAIDSFTVGGRVYGLGDGAVVKLKNLNEVIDVNKNGAYTFPTKLAANSFYEVLIAKQPDYHTCVVENGIGMLEFSMTNIDVRCTPQYAIGGVVSGLPAGKLPEDSKLVLRKGTEEVTVKENGEYKFPTGVPNFESYEVTIATHPTGMFCAVKNAKGTTSGAAVTNVNVECFPSTTAFHVNAVVSGLMAGTKLSLTLNNIGLDVTSNGSAQFSNTVVVSKAVAVAVKTHPEHQTCELAANANSTMGGEDMDVAVICNPNLFVTQVGTLGGTLSAKAAAVAVLEVGHTGTVHRTINAPTGRNLTVEGAVSTSAQMGQITRSVDGRHALMAGYIATAGADIGTAPQSIWRLNGWGKWTYAGNAGTKRALSAFAVDSTGAWVAGDTDANNAGVRYLARGEITPVAIRDTPASIGLGAFDGNLVAFTTASEGTLEKFSGFPTAEATSTPVGIGFNGSSQVVPFDTDGDGKADVAYVAVNSSAANLRRIWVHKYLLQEGSWVRQEGFTPLFPVAPALNMQRVNGVAGVQTPVGRRIFAVVLPAVVASGVTSFASANQLVTFLDDGSTDTPEVTTLAIAPAGTAFRGLALMPAPTTKVPGTITVNNLNAGEQVDFGVDYSAIESQTGAGTLALATAFDEGEQYNLMMVLQPQYQTCAFTSGATGTVGSKVEAVVDCVSNATLSVEVSGMDAAKALTLAVDGQELVAKANGVWTFAKPAMTNSLNVIQILAQPTDQHCTVDNAATPQPKVTCVKAPTIGVVVTGLASGESVVFKTGGTAGQVLRVTAAGTFTFPQTVAKGSTQVVGVFQQPVTQTCYVVAPASVIVNADATISFVCENNIVPKVTVSGMYADLTAKVLIGDETLTLDSNAEFSAKYAYPTRTGPTSTDAVASYAISVAENPHEQACGLSANVITGAAPAVTLTCVDSKLVTVEVQGLTAGEPFDVTLDAKVNNVQTLQARTFDGTVATQSFAKKIQAASLSEFTLQVATQPATQTCRMAALTALPAGDISVVVNCYANPKVSVQATGLASGKSFTVDAVISSVADGQLLPPAWAALPITKTLTISGAAPVAVTPNLPYEAAYSVVIITQPENQTCTIGAYTSPATVDVVIPVTCVDSRILKVDVRDFGTTTTAGGKLVLKAISNDTLVPSQTVDVTQDGLTRFAKTYSPGSTYTVTVDSLPDYRNCTLENATGTIDADQTVVVTCTVMDPPVKVVVTGLQGTESLITLKMGLSIDSTDKTALAIHKVGTYRFENRILSGQSVKVSIKDQPISQTCTFVTPAPAEDGTVSVTADDSVLNVTVDCAPNLILMLVGDGTTAMAKKTGKITIIAIRPDGTELKRIEMATTGDDRLTTITQFNTSGNNMNSVDGMLTRSKNGKLVNFVGYKSIVGIPDSTNEDPEIKKMDPGLDDRVVGQIEPDATNHIKFSIPLRVTNLMKAASARIWAATTDDGSKYFISGENGTGNTEAAGLRSGIYRFDKPANSTVTVDAAVAGNATLLTSSPDLAGQSKAKAMYWFDSKIIYVQAVSYIAVVSDLDGSGSVKSLRQIAGETGPAMSLTQPSQFAVYARPLAPMPTTGEGFNRIFLASTMRINLNSKAVKAFRYKFDNKSAGYWDGSGLGTGADSYVPAFETDQDRHATVLGAITIVPMADGNLRVFAATNPSNISDGTDTGTDPIITMGSELITWVDDDVSLTPTVTRLSKFNSTGEGADPGRSRKRTAITSIVPAPIP